MAKKEAIFKESLEVYVKRKGKLSVESRMAVETMHDLSIALYSRI